MRALPRGGEHRALLLSALPSIVSPLIAPQCINTRYSYGPPELTEAEINADLRFELEAHLASQTDEEKGGGGGAQGGLAGRRGFEFAWYENPKMTIPGVYHVQVFWHLTAREEG
jgi:hypothetical protein